MARKKDTRNYGKFHPRFFGGGIVADPAEAERQTGERATREGLDNLRWYDINKLGTRPERYELEQNRDQLVDKYPALQPPPPQRQDI